MGNDTIPQVRLLSITFNLSPGDIHQPSITLRRNAIESVRIPEWRHMETFAPEHCPVAYAFSMARNRPISIRVRLRGPAGRAFSVRALGPDWVDQAALGCMLPWLYWLLPRRRWEELSVLGDVPVFAIAFPESQAGEEMTEAESTVQLRRHRLGNLGVWVSNTSWRWQYTEDWRGWNDIITTHHRAYCVPIHPSRPWQQDYMEGSNTRLPWTDALEFACLWATLAREPEEYWRGIVRGIRNLGTLGLLRYRMGPSTDEPFTGPGIDRPFNLTGFLDHIRHGSHARAVECYDCAAAVSTFTSLLGVALDQYAFGLPNEGSRVLPIGHDRPRPITWSEHEFAINGTSSVWDACLQLNSRSEPPEGPFLPRVVEGMNFGDYKRLLVGDTAASHLRGNYRGRRDII